MIGKGFGVLTQRALRSEHRVRGEEDAGKKERRRKRHE
jgi:hypothetical protein